MKTKVELLKKLALKITSATSVNDIVGDTISEVLTFIINNFSLKNEVKKSIDIEYISNVMNDTINKDTSDNDLKILSKQIFYVLKKYNFMLINLYNDKDTGVIINDETSGSSGESGIVILPIYSNSMVYLANGYIIGGDQAQSCWFMAQFLKDSNVLRVRLADTKNEDTGFEWEYNTVTETVTKKTGFGELEYIDYEIYDLGGMISNATVKDVEVN